MVHFASRVFCTVIRETILRYATECLSAIY